MNTVFPAVVVALFSLTLPGLAAPNKPATPKDDAIYLGQILEVQDSGQAFKVKHDDKDMVLVVSKGTSIRKRTEKADISAITVGAHVTAEFSLRPDGKYDAKRVLIESKPGKWHGFYGEIVSINPKTKTLTCKKEDGTQRDFPIGAETVIEDNGVKKDFSALANGMMVRCHFQTTPKKWDVDFVTIDRSASGSAPAGNAATEDDK